GHRQESRDSDEHDKNCSRERERRRSAAHGLVWFLTCGDQWPVKSTWRGRADPFFCAVGEHLMLPNRHLALEIVDELAACVERLAAMWRGDRDNYREVADGKRPDPMYGGDRAHGELLGDRRGDVSQDAFHAGMRLVVEGSDLLAVVGLPDGP